MLDAACAWKLGSLAFKLLAGASKALDHEAVATFLEIGATSVEAGEAVARSPARYRAYCGRPASGAYRTAQRRVAAGRIRLRSIGASGCGSGDSGPRRHSSKVPPRWAQGRAGQSRHRADRRAGRGEGRRRRRDVPQGHIRRAAAALPSATRLRGSQARPRLCRRDRHSRYRRSCSERTDHLLAGQAELRMRSSPAVAAQVSVEEERWPRRETSQDRTASAAS